MKLLNEPSFSEIIQRTWELYRQNIKRLFIIALIVSVLYQLFIIFMQRSGMIDLIYQMMQENAKGQDLSAFADKVTSTMHLVIATGIVFYLVILPFATALFQNVVDESWQGRSQPITKHVQFVLSRLIVIAIATLFVYLLLMLSVMVSSMIFGILGILVYAALIIYIPLILYDQKSAFSSISESFKLTIGAYTKSLGIAFICYILLNIPSIGEWLIQSATGTDNSLIFGIDEVVTIFLSAFVWPLVAILKLALYYALKARRYNLKVQNSNLN
ncbi:MAG: hypothetical protein EP298_10675 [Gammaproteobacteria bacterium]|nr:MAG: hypothetical protein EP298_10675 [Gammaproteobacteria bacterium]UTW42232.1 hypothetical protein KFE69_12190 [bacterium SCSIO 12844]